MRWSIVPVSWSLISLATASVIRENGAGLAARATCIGYTDVDCPDPPSCPSNDPSCLITISVTTTSYTSSETIVETSPTSISITVTSDVGTGIGYSTGTEVVDSITTHGPPVVTSASTATNTAQTDSSASSTTASTETVSSAVSSAPCIHFTPSTPPALTAYTGGLSTPASSGQEITSSCTTVTWTYATLSSTPATTSASSASSSRASTASTASSQGSTTKTTSASSGTIGYSTGDPTSSGSPGANGSNYAGSGARARIIPSVAGLVIVAVLPFLLL